MVRQSLLEIIDHREVAPDHWELVFPKAKGFQQAEPGQFVMLLVRQDQAMDPLLRRPLSIFRVGEDRWSVLYRVVGRGTAALSAFRPGDLVDCVGPLGRGFTFDDLEEGTPVALVGGGIGVPPLYFLSQRLLKVGIVPEAFAGFAASSQVVAVRQWEELGVTVRVATEDGRIGHKGLVTDLLEDRLKQGNVRRVFACGPRPMLRAVAAIAHRYGASCQVAMEEWMACGLGVCLSCVVRVRVSEGGPAAWARVCREGPVFDAREVVWADA